MRKRIALWLVAGLALLLLAGSALAQASANYSLSRQALSAGGGSARSSANYGVGDALGQSAIGVLDGLGTQLRAGFWARAAGAPVAGFRLAWDVLAGGGSSRGSAAYRSHDTLGESAIGKLDGTGTRLRAGFWARVGALPGAGVKLVRDVMAGGGSSRGSAAYRSHDTLGQSAIGVLDGVGTTLRAGFWARVSGVPGAGVELVAETSLGQSLDLDGTVRIDVNIDQSVARPMARGVGNTALFDHGLGAYNASVTYDPAGISILEVRGASPFADYLTVNLQDDAGQLSLASFHTQVSGPQGGPVAYFVPRLMGDALHPYDLTLDFLTIVDVVGNRVPQASPTSRTYLRGDSNSDGVVDIIDALFDAQVVVKLRPLSDLNAVNGASVKWDDGGDVLDIIDALLTAQWVVKLRNSDYTSIISVSSPAFANGAPIPTKYTEDGQNVSPPLLWDRVPSNTQTLALIMDDPDAPGGLFTHWVLFNLPPDSRELLEAIPTQGQLANGALQGTNDFGTIGYGGPSPPPGPVHRYIFTVYALDTALGLAPGATRQELIAAMRGHILAKGQLVGTYQR